MSTAVVEAPSIEADISSIEMDMLEIDQDVLSTELERRMVDAARYSSDDFLDMQDAVHSHC